MGMKTQTTDLVYAGIPAAALHAIRVAGADAYEHPIAARAAGGGEPIRCCLRLAQPGESIAMIAFRPAVMGGPYAEIGPVFIHAEACAGGVAQPDFPADFVDRRAVLRPYDAEGLMLDGLVAEPGESERLLDDLFADAAVDSVQVRNVIAGCWNFTVHRA
jgi:hypothetical protein